MLWKKLTFSFYFCKFVTLNLKQKKKKKNWTKIIAKKELLLINVKLHPKLNFNLIMAR